jgi:hypothetical protein
LILEKSKINPYVSYIESSEVDVQKIHSVIESFSTDIGVHLDSGNFPIKIVVSDFYGEDSELIAFALVSQLNCEVRLNSKEKWNKNKLKLIIFHEFGHCLGFDHDEKIPIMAEYYEDENSQFKSIPLYSNKVKTMLKNKEVYRIRTRIKNFDGLIGRIVSYFSSKEDETRYGKNNQLKIKNSRLKLIWE